ncbi:hypothetical protein V3G39_13830 [Dermatophilaceae bacterium Sec6.4]
MEITAALGADLALLTAALVDLSVDPRTDVAGTILGFATTTRLAVASFLGLSITITDRTRALAHEVVLRLTLLDDHAAPGDIATSLLLPAPTDRTEGQPDIQVVLYAGSPGAFVDLAADLAFLAGSELDSADLDHHQSLAREPDITGVLQDQAVISQAIGVLLAGGCTREQANAELETLAQEAHTDRITEAARILTVLTPGGPDILSS